jgi:hypothetical protein
MENHLNHSVKVRNDKGCPLSPLLFNIVSGFVARGLKQEQETKVIQIAKEVKLSLFADDMILHLRDLKTLPKKPLKIINSFSKVA